MATLLGVLHFHFIEIKNKAWSCQRWKEFLILVGSWNSWLKPVLLCQWAATSSWSHLSVTCSSDQLSKYAQNWEVSSDIGFSELKLGKSQANWDELVSLFLSCSYKQETMGGPWRWMRAAMGITSFPSLKQSRTWMGTEVSRSQRANGFITSLHPVCIPWWWLEKSLLRYNIYITLPEHDPSPSELCCCFLLWETSLWSG